MKVNRVSFVDFKNLNKEVKNVELNRGPEKVKKFSGEDEYTTMALGEEGGSKYPDIAEF